MQESFGAPFSNSEKAVFRLGAYHNERFTVFASAARTASENSQDFENMQGGGLKLVIDVTAITLTPSVVFTIQGKDTVSGKYYTLLASAAIVGVGTTVLTIHPDMTAVANVTAKDVLPRDWRVIAVAGDADSITYSVGACTIIL